MVLGRIHDTAAASVAVSGRQSSTYDYRVSACNSAGRSDFSAAARIRVTVPPPTAPEL
jgi:hypothetical protein